MQASDREEFRSELAKLCVGFNVPLTRAREEGYWAALARMSLAQFRKCVDFAIGPDYDGDEFPKTGQIWRIHRGPVVKPDANVPALPADQDHLAYFANRLLFMHMTHREGLGSTGTFIPGEAKKSGMNDCHASTELQLCLRYKRDLVAQFCGFVQEGDELATPAAFIRWWAGGLAKVSQVLPRTLQAYTRMAEGEEAQQPFPAYMARELMQAEAA